MLIGWTSRQGLPLQEENFPPALSLIRRGRIIGQAVPSHRVSVQFMAVIRRRFALKGNA